jgi:hypothetical protein
VSRFLLTVDDEHGTAAVVLDVDLTKRQRRLLEELVPKDLSDRDRWQMLAVLTRLIADERAYERECERRGLLPLI